AYRDPRGYRERRSVNDGQHRRTHSGRGRGSARVGRLSGGSPAAWPGQIRIAHRIELDLVGTASERLRHERAGVAVDNQERKRSAYRYRPATLSEVSIIIC